MLPDLTRITRKASTDPTCRFTALAHYLNEEFLLDTWLRLNRRGSAGIDRQRETAIRDLVDRSRRHAYQAPPVRHDGCIFPNRGNRPNCVRWASRPWQIA